MQAHDSASPVNTPETVAARRAQAWRSAGPLLGAAALALYPLLAGNFGIDLISKVMVFAVFALSLELAFAKHWHLGLGLAIIASVAVLPGGLIGLWSVLRRRWVGPAPGSIQPARGLPR